MQRHTVCRLSKMYKSRAASDMDKSLDVVNRFSVSFSNSWLTLAVKSVTDVSFIADAVSDWSLVGTHVK